MSRLDVLRSWVRAAGDGARARLVDAGPLATLRTRLASLRDGRLPVPAPRITACLAHAEGVRELSASLRDGAVRVHATLENGEHVELAITPVSAQFAARGAKEVSFQIEPAEHAHGAAARALVGSLSGLIAHTLFSVVAQGYSEGEAALAERDGEGKLRVDLRSLPSLRRAPKALSVAFDALVLDGVDVMDDAMVLRVRLAGLG